MAKLTFNPETQLHLQLKFDTKILKTATDRYRATLAAAALSVGCKPYEVVVYRISITNTGAQVVFYKNRKYLTAPGTHVNLHPLFDSVFLRPSGAPQDVVIERFEYRAAERAYYAIVRNADGKLLTPKSTICISFLSTETMYAKQNDVIASSNQ